MENQPIAVPSNQKQTNEVVVVRNKISDNQKWGIAFVGAILFVLISMPTTYKLTDKASLRFDLGSTAKPGGPTGWGMAVHFIIFLLIFRLLLIQF